MTRHTSATVISAYRATSVVDTPMRKVEVLEAADGRVIFRATEFSPGNTRADVHLIYLEHHEAKAQPDRRRRGDRVLPKPRRKAA